MDELLHRVQAALGDAFRVETELPAGGMSRIFLANEQSLNRRVVVKVLPPNMTSEVSAARFRQEMEMLARLQHPHILPILSSGTRGELLYYIMPFVAGESLRHRLSEHGKLPVEDAIRILTEVADALGYAHAAGVLHRDIKPENILLEGRHAVLADFGVARALVDARTGAKLTATGVSVGTPGYMSPEQVSGDSIDARADLYALAVVGYEMLSGKPPFEGPSAQAVLTAHLITPPLPLTEVRPEVPAHVSRAISRALSKRPEERFLTGQEFADALGRSHLDAPVAPSPAAPRRSVLSLAVGMLLVAAAAWLLRPRGDSIPAPIRSAIQVAADSGRLDLIAALLDSAGVTISHGDLGDVASRVAGSLRVTSDPSGAEVTIARATPLAGFAERAFKPFGTTPTEEAAVVAGEYAIRVSLAGSMPRVVVTRIDTGANRAAAVTLLPADTSLGAVIQIDSGRSPVDGSAVPAFILSQFEVTNEQFQRFVSAGGYRNLELWPATIQVGERVVPAAEAMARFVDRTGLPGPRNWEGGKHGNGRSDHPVSGVSWYEASAYAKWAGGVLPTAHQWWRAALGDSLSVYPWGIDATGAQYRANLEGVETTAVGSYPLGVSRFGAMDLAGNVREWLADAVSGEARYLAAGGSWQDPFYMADLTHMEGFPPAYASATIGFRVARPLSTAGRN
ncbi:MAG TPA: bifunctional serine/threonine-protein kinase/formylglycine-generating enzyme family protein [Gemmatimonadales bacterium]|nr:bifunctional serine/threonine-protein kinase/formylglycine-generating enzyme family protein [Gemmatimonadales bacterium]